jgi:farnesyl diphosphate synthase
MASWHAGNLLETKGEWLMTTTSFSMVDWMKPRLHQIEQTLNQAFSAKIPPLLADAMRYAVLDGGKRLRPLMALAAAEVLGANTLQHDMALRAACAVELIHAYSLVHDDMPCMDNDVLRRGKPTVHVQFGQAQALLAGDALQALAFEVLLPAHASDWVLAAKLCRSLALAAGAQGMAGGQAIDLASVGLPLNQTQLEQMHQLKTGALLQSSIEMGALCAGVSTQAMQHLNTYAQCIGLAFQVVDDVLDVTADTQTLGKTAGKDQASDKPTYVALLGLEKAQQYAQDLWQQAQESLLTSQLPRTQALQAIGQWVVNRAS